MKRRTGIELSIGDGFAGSRSAPGCAVTPERYLTAAEFGRLTNLPRSTVYALIRCRKLREGVHWVKMGRHIRFPYPQVLDPSTYVDEAPPTASAPSPQPAKSEADRRPARPRARQTAIDFGWRP